MGRHNKLFSTGVGSGTSSIKYTAPSGTTIGSARGARCLWIHFYNFSGGATELCTAQYNGGPIVSGLVPLGRSVSFNLNIVLEAGNQIDIECPTTCYYYIGGEEYTIG